MNYAYIRVSTDKQTTENQRYEILNFVDRKAIRFNEWILETVLAFAFSLSAGIERNMIASHTCEALARKKQAINPLYLYL